MTEKRFSIDSFIKDYKSHIIDNNGEIKTLEEYVNYLNNLNEENEQLKESVYSWSKSYNRVYEENKQLKQQLQSILKLTKKIEDCTYDIKLIGDVE